ncbi:MAG TPA: hypothetical protein VHW66_24505 [Stellaceae bacterium]|nr:hypothetical protein [Stellaceae bacterium]
MSGPKITITLATATPGGGFPLYGGAVAEVVNAVDPSLNVECRNTKGSTENVPLLEAGTAYPGLDQAKETTAANTAAAAPDPALIHPGVVRYLREIGVLP